jgi:hypothetical protein
MGVHRETPRAELLNPINHADASAKPRECGFWTSTYHERFGSGWVQWCLSEEYRCERADPTFQMWTLEPAPAARIYTIDTYNDLQRLCQIYGQRRWDRGTYDTYPDWSLVAEAYDGIHLTRDGELRTRYTHPLNLYGWDCESTLWFRWAFSGVADLGRVRCEAWDEVEGGVAGAA